MYSDIAIALLDYHMKLILKTDIVIFVSYQNLNITQTETI